MNDARAAVLFLVGAGAVAWYAPSRRASRADRLIALRVE
jgi:hypothetical protein